MQRSADVQRAVQFLSGVLFGVFSVGVFPVLCRFQKDRVVTDADERQRLLVFGVLVAGMVENRLNGLAAAIFLAICAGDMTFGQAAFLHFASGPAQIPRSVQISRLAALAGFLIFTAGLAVSTAATNFLCAIHRDEFPLER